MHLVKPLGCAILRLVGIIGLEANMQILAVDIGTGTQDVLLFDTDREPENALKLVMPSPTVMVAQSIRAATRAGRRDRGAWPFLQAPRRARAGLICA